MGDIEDEYDHDDEPKLQKIDDYNFIVDGNYLIDDLDDELDLKLDNVNHDTISGFVLHLLGEIPDDNQERSVTYENLTFKITGVKGNRVTKIKLTIKKSNYEPVASEVSTELENKKDSQNTTKLVTKQTFSEINSAKVTAPEGVK